MVKKKWYNKSLKEMKYNPIGMWGAWIGALVGWLIYAFTDLTSICPFNRCVLNPFSIFSNWALMRLISAIFVGFLIGWGIHSLIRSLRK